MEQVNLTLIMPCSFTQCTVQCHVLVCALGASTPLTLTRSTLHTLPHPWPFEMFDMVGCWHIIGVMLLPCITSVNNIYIIRT